MADLVSTLTALLGAESVTSQGQIAAELGTSLAQVTVDHTLPQAVVYPTSEAQLAAVMACAHQNQWRVLPCGAGSKLTWGSLAQGVDLVVSTARLNQIIDHAVGDMTLTAQAGLTLAELAPKLAAVNQFLPLDPAYPHRATLGGMVATGDAGSLRQRYGGVRDMLIGLSLVRYDGQIAKAGGRVVKNVAGYDLMKLFTGSYGSLGMISQLTFRLFPVQETSKTLVISGNIAEIQTLTAAVRRSSLTPVALDLLSPTLAAALGSPESFTLAARFQSIAPGVEEQLAVLRQLLPAGLAVQELAEAEDQAFWHRANDYLFPAETTATTTVKAKVGLLPTTACDLLTQLQQLAPGHLARIHASSGIGTVCLEATTATPDLLTKLRSICGASQGYLVLLEASPDLKQALGVWGDVGPALALMEAVKAQFDPQHRLSPGRFVGGL
ncbi:FAD-binding oxidoreductase [Leptolyngbya sp. BL0902]|uniref:FAD-binding oxidoreductase n=1 Tax=Leptolyngbya sp. BL0902 TaxID=1115757 RepID=UPI0018E7590F|nr:FAD-binding oxidoreductase [Leptolyngbya sp. BL0902]QQE66191.1 FAD-binding oxidoreductase [Leptolyngbya sp. BL0902]